MSGAICALIAGASVLISTGPFTLAWQHSVQHLRWEEDWRVEAGQLVITEARVRGTGAGMEIPPDAHFADGSWHYRPALPPLAEVQLADSQFGGAYEICRAGQCRKLFPAGGPVVLRPCQHGHALP